MQAQNVPSGRHHRQIGVEVYRLEARDSTPRVSRWHDAIKNPAPVARPTLFAAVMLCSIGASSGCDLRPPHVLVTVTDDQSRAADATAIRVGTDLAEMEERSLDGKSFPVTLVYVAESAGIALRIYVEAVGADGAILARGQTMVTPQDGETTDAVVLLGQPCGSETDCDDGEFCNGSERCDFAVCADGAPPCPQSGFDCVKIECRADVRMCLTMVDHNTCAARDPTTYCNPEYGCIPGEFCSGDEECQDGYVCNGAERCIEGRCGGGPPDVDDMNPCTLDTCNEVEGARHIPDPQADGRVCVDPMSSEQAICLAGACVPSECSDGYVDPRTELCDDANSNPNDACNACFPTRWTAGLVSGLGPGGGLPSGLVLASPSGIAVDRLGNTFLSDTEHHRIYRIDAMTSSVTVAAGIGLSGFTGDGGPATRARLSSPKGLAVDGLGNLIFADSGNHRVRWIDAKTGVIRTVAGSGVSAFGGDGTSALTAQLSEPTDVAVDGQGTIYIADSQNHRIRSVDAAGIIETVAGNGGAGFGADGVEATDTMLFEPTGVALDADGDLLIADSQNHRIRRVELLTGLISTMAGTGVPGDQGDGVAATAAQLFAPSGLFFDTRTNTTFIADTGNHEVRQVLPSGTISNLAGTGASGFSGDGGSAVNAELSGPTAVAVLPDDRLLIADSGNNRIRTVDRGTAQIETLAGSGAVFESSEGRAATSVSNLRAKGMAFDSRGRMIVINQAARQVWRIDPATQVVTIIAGDGRAGTTGDGGSALSAQFETPSAVAVDGNDNLFIADKEAHTVRRVDAATGIISGFAGNGTNGFCGDGSVATMACLSGPEGLAVTATGLYIADTGNHRLRLVESGMISTVAGGGNASPGDGGPAISAQLSSPTQLAIENSSLFFTERGAHRVRRVDLSTGDIETIAGDGQSGNGGDGGQATAARLNGPQGVAVFAGDLFVSDSGNSRVRRLDLASGVMSAVTATTAVDSHDGRPASMVQLISPTALGVDQDGNLFVCQDEGGTGAIRKVDAVTGIVSTAVGTVDPSGDGALAVSALGGPSALTAGPGGTIWVADAAAGRIRIVDLDAQVVRTVVGYPAGLDETGADPRFFRPLASPMGIAFDPVGGYVYFSERDGHSVSRVDVSGQSWTVEPYVGARGESGFANGVGIGARLSYPLGLAVDSDARRLYVADSGNHVVRSVDLTTDRVETIAGVAQQRGDSGDGIPAEQALFDTPSALAVSVGGAIYVADAGVHRVKMIDSSGDIHLVIGVGAPGSVGVGSPARAFSVDAPEGVATDRFGNLFISSRNTIRLVTAGDDGVADGDDEVFTIYGAPPRDQLPASVTRCLWGLAVVSQSAAADDDRLLMADQCQGFLLRLDRM